MAHVVGGHGEAHAAKGKEARDGCEDHGSGVVRLRLVVALCWVAALAFRKRAEAAKVGVVGVLPPARGLVDTRY